jgi:hypothetical protein
MFLAIAFGSSDSLVSKIIISRIASSLIFQLWVGVVIYSQPFFISGIENDEEARASAFGAMGMFLVTFLASLGGMWYDTKYKAEPIEEGDEAGYQLSHGEVSTYGTSS